MSIKNPVNYEEFVTYIKEHGLVDFEKFEAILKEHGYFASWMWINDRDLAKLEITEEKLQKIIKIFDLVNKREGFTPDSELHNISADVLYLAAMIVDGAIK